jgi:hypothetical protein
MRLSRLKNFANARILTGASTLTAVVITVSWYYTDRSHEPLLAMLASVGAFLSTFKYTFLSFDLNLTADRIALVVGNRNYQNSPPLLNSASDAEAMCSTLENLGFRIIKRIDPSADELKKAIYDFQTILGIGGVGLFFYSGHAAQIDGNDYILPVDARLKTREDFQAQAINLNDLLGPVDRIIENSPEHNGSIALYSTESGRDAFDFFIKPEETKEKSGASETEATNRPKASKPPQHSPFATELLKLCPKWNLEIFDLFRELCRRLPEATNNLQVPWISASVNTEFYFKPLVKEEVGVLKILIFDACRSSPFFRPPVYYVEREPPTFVAAEMTSR